MLDTNEDVKPVMKPDVTFLQNAPAHSNTVRSFFCPLRMANYQQNKLDE
jgi:hypothetical protein